MLQAVKSGADAVANSIRKPTASGNAKVGRLPRIPDRVAVRLMGMTLQTGP